MPVWNRKGVTMIRPSGRGIPQLSCKGVTWNYPTLIALQNIYSIGVLPFISNEIDHILRNLNGLWKVSLAVSLDLIYEPHIPSRFTVLPRHIC